RGEHRPPAHLEDTERRVAAPAGHALRPFGVDQSRAPRRMGLLADHAHRAPALLDVSPERRRPHAGRPGARGLTRLASRKRHRATRITPSRAGGRALPRGYAEIGMRRGFAFSDFGSFTERTPFSRRAEIWSRSKCWAFESVNRRR